MHLENHSLALSPFCACFAILQMWRKVHTCNVSAAKICFWNTTCFISVVFAKRQPGSISSHFHKSTPVLSESYLRLLSLCYSFPLKLGRNNIASKNESAKTISPKDTEIRTRKAITTSLLLDSSPKLNRFCDEVFSILRFVHVFVFVDFRAGDQNRKCRIKPIDHVHYIRLTFLRDSVGNECYSVSS